MLMDWTVSFLMVATVVPRALVAQEIDHYVSPWKTPWTYELAAEWGQLDPNYAVCNAGKEQSPIDIRNAEKADLPALGFEYKSGPLKYVINNSHTIRVNYQNAPGSGDMLVVGGERYQLTQFHFHRPSEEHVNGKPYPMEIHLMHQARDGKTAGVTVFLVPGRTNTTVQKIWAHMPKSEGQEAVAGVAINPADLLPHDLGYFTYMGSQTAPPCTEGITWFVLKTPLEVSREQIEAFARLYPNNVRPIQPLNGRVVKESR